MLNSICIISCVLYQLRGRMTCRQHDFKNHFCKSDACVVMTSSSLGLLVVCNCIHYLMEILVIVIVEIILGRRFLYFFVGYILIYKNISSLPSPSSFLTAILRNENTFQLSTLESTGENQIEHEILFEFEIFHKVQFGYFTKCKITYDHVAFFTHQ